jgi:hypothetical protein
MQYSVIGFYNLTALKDPWKFSGSFLNESRYEREREREREREEKAVEFFQNEIRRII